MSLFSRSTVTAVDNGDGASEREREKNVHLGSRFHSFQLRGRKVRHSFAPGEGLNDKRQKKTKNAKLFSVATQTHACQGSRRVTSALWLRGLTKDKATVTQLLHRT